MTEFNPPDAARAAYRQAAGLGRWPPASRPAGIARADARPPRRRRRPAISGAAEYWAKKGDVSLNLWRKRRRRAQPGEPPLPVLFLVHGSSNSPASSYDLTVPGKGEYSFMNVFARARLRRLDDGPRRLRPLSAAPEQFRYRQRRRGSQGRDPVVARETGQARMHFYGTSSGAIRAGAYRPGASPSGSTGWCCPPSPTRATARRHLQAARRAARRLPHPQYAQARPRHDPLDLHPRRPRLELRSGGGGGDRRRGNEVRRPGSDRHLSRHGRQPAAGRPEEGAVRRC